MLPHGTTFKFKYLGEFEIEIKTILEHESRAHMGLIHEKNQRPKISCYCTFKHPVLLNSPMVYLRLALTIVYPIFMAGRYCTSTTNVSRDCLVRFFNMYLVIKQN
jgi:hypothetical protein